MVKEIQPSPLTSILEEGADKTLRLDLKIPNPDTATPIDVVRYRIAVGQAWLEEDIKRGILPQNLKDLSEAGDYMDQNMYLIDEDLKESKVGNFYVWDGWDVQKICDHFNAVGDALSEWLRAGRSGNALEYLDTSDIHP